jgi:copper(I)-binding protein
MKKLIAAVILLLSFSASAAEKDLVLTNCWAKPTLEGKNLTAAFFDLKNNGKKETKFNSVKSSVGTAEIHNMVEENGVMQMRHMNSVTIPAGKAVSFKPKQMHVMLMQLDKPLKEGDKVDLTLSFENGDSIKSSCPVKNPVVSENHEDHSGHSH